jgi:flagellar hook-associated protein 1 FlgK
VSEIGAQVSDSGRLSDQARASREQIAGMQASEAGVNLDEELAEMVAVQHAYSASARLLSVYDEMLGTLIQRTGA